MSGRVRPAVRTRWGPAPCPGPGPATAVSPVRRDPPTDAVGLGPGDVDADPARVVRRRAPTTGPGRGRGRDTRAPCRFRLRCHRNGESRSRGGGPPPPLPGPSRLSACVVSVADRVADLAALVGRAASGPDHCPVAATQLRGREVELPTGRAVRLWITHLFTPPNSRKPGARHRAACGSWESSPWSHRTPGGVHTATRSNPATAHTSPEGGASRTPHAPAATSPPHLEPDHGHPSPPRPAPATTPASRHLPAAPHRCRRLGPGCRRTIGGDSMRPQTLLIRRPRPENCGQLTDCGQRAHPQE